MPSAHQIHPANLSDPPDEADAAVATIATARRVLALEAEALASLSADLDGAFSDAVAKLFRVTGRIVVTGIGKSGHVARKIAATLASTGSPALYVHPGEASHGDLGMITDADAVVALSNSGETSELSDLVAYSRRFSIPLIAITARADSALARAADLTLLLPATPEACPMGLAPTTSTTAMLGLGDAIAIALLERRGFTEERFRLLHPGGRLGRVLVRVSEIMHGSGELPLTDPETPMSEAIVAMTARGFGCIGIVDDGGSLLGIITDGDLRRHMGPDLLTRTAGDVMTPGPKTIAADALAAEALAAMNARSITSLFVVAADAGGGSDRPVGLVHVHDLLRAGIA